MSSTKKDDVRNRRSNVEKEFTPFERAVRRNSQLFGSKEVGERVTTAVYFHKKRSMMK